MDTDIRDLRIRGIQEAASRSRIAFFITVVASGTILVATYNNHFPWNRNYQKYQRTRQQAIQHAPCLPSDYQAPDPPDKVKNDPGKLAEWNRRLEREREEICNKFVPFRQLARIILNLVRRVR